MFGVRGRKVKNKETTTGYLKNTILMILNHNFPDVRVCQEADVLVAQGYEVFIVVPLSKQSSSPEYKVENYNLIEIDLHQNLFSKVIGLWSYKYEDIMERLLNNAAFKSVKRDILAVHVHDLIWCEFGRNLSLKLNCLFVADFHENYPALIDCLHEGEKGSFNFRRSVSRYFRSYEKLVKYENIISTQADKIIVVAEENKTRLINAFALEQSKVHVVSNTKNPAKYENFGLPESSNTINIFYHGTIQQLRGLRTLINAFIKANNKLLTLTIIGFGPECEEKAFILDKFNGELPTNIELIDWTLDRDLVVSKLKNADLCVIPHESSEIGQTTIPNKIFEYMCHGKAVLVSNLKPLQRIVEETDAGFVFPAGDVNRLADIFTNLTSRNQLTPHAKKAREAACNEYSWSVDAAELVKLYEELNSLKDK